MVLATANWMHVGPWWEYELARRLQHGLDQAPPRAMRDPPAEGENPPSRGRSKGRSVASPCSRPLTARGAGFRVSPSSMKRPSKSVGRQQPWHHHGKGAVLDAMLQCFPHPGQQTTQPTLPKEKEANACTAAAAAAAGTEGGRSRRQRQKRSCVVRVPCPGDEGWLEQRPRSAPGVYLPGNTADEAVKSAVYLGAWQEFKLAKIAQTGPPAEINQKVPAQDCSSAPMRQPVRGSPQKVLNRYCANHVTEVSGRDRKSVV